MGMVIVLMSVPMVVDEVSVIVRMRVDDPLCRMIGLRRGGDGAQKPPQIYVT